MEHGAKSIEFKNQKKSPTPLVREIELSQRTGRLSIVCLMGRGNPLAIILVI